MANTITINVLGDTRGFKSAMSGVQGDLGRLGAASQKAGSFLKSSLKVAAVGAVAAGVAIGKFASDSITAASDLNETISKTKTIFGDASPEIMAFGRNAATSLGMSTNEALTGVSTFGNFFDQIGIGTKRSAEMSKSFVTMAADLGSFHNAAPVEVMEALSAATRGEYDSLQKFIPTINAAAVEQKAFAMTGKTTAKELTNAEKASAMYALAIKGQGAAQGDFAKTSGSLANQQKILAAQFEAVKTKIGTALLPIMQQLMGVLLKEGMPALKQFSKWFAAEGPAAIDRAVAKFNEFLPTIKKVGTFLIENAGTIAKLVAGFYALTAVIAIVGPVIQGITAAFKAYKAIATAVKAVQFALNVLWLANPIGLVIAAIAALVAIFVIAYKKSDTFRAIVDKSWAAIKKATVAVWNFIKDLTLKVWNAIKDAAVKAAEAVKNAVTKAWNAIKSATSSVWNGIKSAVMAVWNFFRNAVSTYFNAYKNVITTVWNAVKSVTTSVWNAVKNAVTNAANNIRNAISNAWNAAKNLTSNAWNAMKSAVQNGVQRVISFVQGLPGKIKGFFSGASSWLLSAGKNIIQGLLDGISGMIGSVKSKLGELTNMIPDWKGPASKDKRLLRPVGKMIMDGLVKGFDDGREGIKNSLSKITDLIEKTMDQRFKSDKKAAAASREVLQGLKDENAALMANAHQREVIASRLEKAQEKLNAVVEASKDYAANIKSSVLDFGNIGSVGKDEDGNVSLGGILGDLRTKVTDAKTYQTVLNRLIKMGLNKTTLDQLAQMGVEGGLATAKAIVSGGKEAINQVNRLTQQLAVTGKAMGDRLAKEMYGAGIKAAQGMVNGLESQEKRLIRVATNLGRQLANAVKKELGIHSPSRVFQRLGEQTVAGMEIGLKDTHGVERAMVRLSDAMVNGFSKPALSATAGGGTGGTTINLNVNVPATANPAATGKEIQRVLDEYHRTGGIRRA